MKKLLLAAIPFVGFTLAATTGAKAFVPIVLAGIVVGSVLFGAITGHAILSNQAYNYTPVPMANVTPVPDQAPACYLHRNPAGHLVKIC